MTFAVSDRGPGFAAGDENRIFASFYRGTGAPEDDGAAAPPLPDRAVEPPTPRSTPAGSPGTGSEGRRSHSSLGLGLSLVKRIAQAHGGDVTAGNRPGGGATFTLRLAVTPPERERPR